MRFFYASIARQRRRESRRDPRPHAALPLYAPCPTRAGGANAALPRTRLCSASPLADTEGRGARQRRTATARRRAARAQPAVLGSRRRAERDLRRAGDDPARRGQAHPLRARGRCARALRHLDQAGEAGHRPRRTHRDRRRGWTEPARLRRAGHGNDVPPSLEEEGGGRSTRSSSINGLGNSDGSPSLPRSTGGDRRCGRQAGSYRRGS